MSAYRRSCKQHLRIIVIGLGYVGLPLAVALARQFDVTGLDIDPERIAELRDGRDRTARGRDRASSSATSLKVTDEADGLRGRGRLHRHRADPGRMPRNRPDLSARARGDANGRRADRSGSGGRRSSTKAPSIQG